MRAPQPFVYVIEHLPRKLPIFSFIQKHGPVSDKEAYANLNMGAGFAFYISHMDVGNVLKVAFSLGFQAFLAGYIEESEEKRVVIKPKGLEYKGSSLGIR